MAKFNDLIVVRVVSTGNVYAYPRSKYADLPCFRIQDGEVMTTSFARHELKYMVEVGSAVVIGVADISLSVKLSGGE